CFLRCDQMLYLVSDIKVHADQKQSIARFGTFRGSVIISRHLADCGRRSFVPCPVFAKGQGSCSCTFSYFAHDDHIHEKTRSENKTAPYTSAAHPRRSPCHSLLLWQRRSSAWHITRCISYPG